MRSVSHHRLTTLDLLRESEKEYSTNISYKYRHLFRDFVKYLLVSGGNTQVNAVS